MGKQSPLAMVTSRRKELTKVLISLLLALAHCEQLTTDANLELATAVILSRHSIKAPSSFTTDPLEGCLALPSGSAYWGTDSGLLTRDGLLVAEAQGRFLKERYASIHQCDTGNALALADDEERDEETARGLLTGLYDGCDAIPSAVYSPGELVHLLFSEGQDDNLYPGCSRATESQTLGMVGNDVDSYFHSNFMPQLVNISKFANCSGLLTLASTWQGGYWTTFSGGLKIAAKYADTWMTQALSGKTVTSGNGEEISLDTALSMYKVTGALFDLYRNAFNLRNFGSQPIASILATLDQVVNGTQSEIDDQLLPALTNKIVFYVGHDVQIAFLRQLLNLNWESPGWLWNQPTFAGEIAHELFKDKTTGKYLVRLGFVSDSPTGMLETEKTNSSKGVSWVPIAIPGCSSNSSDPYMCDYITFKQLVSSRLSTECMSDAMKGFMDGVDASFHPTTSSSSGLSTTSVVLIVIGSVLVAVAFVVGLGLTCWQKAYNREQLLEGADDRRYSTMGQIIADQ